MPGILNTMTNLYFNKWNTILAVCQSGHKAIFNNHMSTHFDFFWQEILRQWDEQAVDNIGFRFHKDKGQSVCHHPGEGPMQMVRITCQISGGLRGWLKKTLMIRISFSIRSEFRLWRKVVITIHCAQMDDKKPLLTIQIFGVTKSGWLLKVFHDYFLWLVKGRRTARERDPRSTMS